MLSNKVLTNQIKDRLVLLFKTSNIIICNSQNNRLYIKKYYTSNNNNINNKDSNWIQTPNITVCGVGGGGCNSVNNMIKKQLYGVDFIVANTDAQALAISESKNVIQLGKSLTKGLGAGALPHVGKQAAEESIEDLMNEIGDAQMLFVTAGMGGGTGTGGAPVIAAAAKAKGILTVGIVTKPFQFEGRHRMKLAEAGLAELEKSVDSLIVIPNQKLMDISNDLYIGNAFQMVDDVLYNGIKGISDILVKQGIINLDFADVRSIMCNSGKALMGVGEAEGKDRDTVAANMALNNPLLENIDISGAKGVLLNISHGEDVKLQEVNKIVSLVSSKVDPSANIIFGSAFDRELDGKIRVTLIVTGMNDQIQIQQVQPTPQQQEPLHSNQNVTQQQQPKFNNQTVSQPQTQSQQPLNFNQQPQQQFQQQTQQQQVYQSNVQQPQQPQQFQQQQQFQQTQQQFYQTEQEKPKSRFSFFTRFFSGLGISSSPKQQPKSTPGSNWD